MFSKTTATVEYWVCTSKNEKSSHLKISEKKVFEKDMLFATLETSSRRIENKNGAFILTDTVGFIKKLPHHLIEAFKSTLEEINESDLIID